MGDLEEIIRFGTNPKRLDTNGDGLFDLEEIQLGSNPLVFDTNQNGLSDFWSFYNPINLLNETIPYERGDDSCVKVSFTGRIENSTNPNHFGILRLGERMIPIRAERQVYAKIALDSTEDDFFSWIPGPNLPTNATLFLQITSFVQPKNAMCYWLS